MVIILEVKVLCHHLFFSFFWAPKSLLVGKVMNRDEFIASLIGEFSIQQNVDESLENRALYMYRKLCFDYPLLSLGSSTDIDRFSRDIKCINSLLLEYSRSTFDFNKNYLKFKNIFSLNNIFLTNVTEHIPSLLHSPTLEISKCIQGKYESSLSYLKTI